MSEDNHAYCKLCLHKYEMRERNEDSILTTGLENILSITGIIIAFFPKKRCTLTIM